MFKPLHKSMARGKFYNSAVRVAQGSSTMFNHNIGPFLNIDAMLEILRSAKMLCLLRFRWLHIQEADM